MPIHSRPTRLVCSVTLVAASVVSLATAPIGVASAATSVCPAAHVEAFTAMGKLSGQTGEYFRHVRAAIRDDVVGQEEAFDTADRLIDELSRNPANRADITARLIKTYTAIDDAMVAQGYRYGEWRLAFPQLIANNTAFVSLPPLTANEAASIAAHPEQLQDKVAQLAPGAGARQFVEGLNTLRLRASDKLKRILDDATPQLAGPGGDLATTDWRAATREVADEAKRCADELGGTPTARIPADYPRVYFPDTAHIRGVARPEDTGIFAPLEDVPLHAGDLGEAASSGSIALLLVVIGLVARRIPQFIAQEFSGGLAGILPPQLARMIPHT